MKNLKLIIIFSIIVFFILLGIIGIVFIKKSSKDDIKLLRTESYGDQTYEFYFVPEIKTSGNVMEFIKAENLDSNTRLYFLDTEEINESYANYLNPENPKAKYMDSDGSVKDDLTECTDREYCVLHTINLCEEDSNCIDFYTKHIKGYTDNLNDKSILYWGEFRYEIN